MHELPPELAAGLANAAVGQRESALAAATTALIERYQADRPARAEAPIVGSALLATAYLLYRMPATYAAVRSALAQIPEGVVAPRSQLDLGGGTGAALWAAADRWPDLTDQQVLDTAPDALALGRTLVASSTLGSLRSATWARWTAPQPAGDAVGGAGPSPTLPSSDLVTVSYVLSELAEPDRVALIDAAQRAAAQLLVIVEPGTRSGYRRVLAARDQLLDAGWSVVAPCPHQERCPMNQGGSAGGPEDWCHFAARVSRTAVHRRLKQADLSYEDEKFSYLVLSRHPVTRPAARVLRHPRVAKGRIGLTLCQTPPAIEVDVVPKRSGDLYRAARRVAWGDPWPPEKMPPGP